MAWLNNELLVFGSATAVFRNRAIPQSVKLVPDLYEMFTCTLRGLRQDTGTCPGDPTIEVGRTYITSFDY